jgi:hypothetical protein
VKLQCKNIYISIIFIYITTIIPRNYFHLNFFMCCLIRVFLIDKDIIDKFCH